MSKRIRVSSFVSGLVVGLAVLLPAPASAGPGGNDDVQACVDGLAGRPGGYVGACNSYFRSSNNNAAAATAYFCRTFIVPAGFFPTQGACVSEIVAAGGVVLVP